MGNPICEGCGKEILVDEDAIKIEYGTLGFTAHPHAKLNRKTSDWFHRICDVAIRS